MEKNVHSFSKFVFVRRGQKSSLQQPYTGPYKVIDVQDKFFKVLFGDREELISIDRLKPAHLDTTSDIKVANPPKRGRPPKNSFNQCSPSVDNTVNDNVSVKFSHFGRPLIQSKHFG